MGISSALNSDEMNQAISLDEFQSPMGISSALNSDGRVDDGDTLQVSIPHGDF